HASSLLKNLRRQIASCQGEITSQTAKFIQANASKLTDTITTTRNDRVCVLVKISEKNSIKGYIHGESASGATAYVEPECLIQLNNRLETLLSSEEEEIKRILYELSQEVKSVADGLYANCETLGIIDSIFAKAHYAHEIDGCVATINEQKNLYIKKARHPLIDPKKVVANTYRLSNHSLLLITGSNTGGKSVTLKTIGLFVLMTYCGFPISADEATLPKFDALYIDIGDEQSIEQSLSTFSAHISKLAQFTKQVSENSLVILDELGSGTDPKEGEALAIAVLDELRKKKCMILATTHYSKLKSVSSKWKEVLCSSVEFDMETMRPTYRYIEGINGQSNAFLIAAHFGLDQQIIENAKKIKEENETEDEKLIQNLNQLMNENLQLQEKLQLENIKIQQKEIELSKKEQALNHKIEKIMEEAKEKANEIIENAKEESDEILSEIRENKDLKIHEALQIRSKLNDLIEEEVKESDEIFHVNDTVLIKKYNYYGEVLEVKPKYLLVLANGLKMKLDKADCTHTKKQKKVKKISTISQKTISKASLECNVIGERVVDALAIVDKYLDTAIASRLYQVRIIHGVGSGALRSAIWDYLKKNKYVASYRIGGEGEGGSGATVVELKGGNHGK
ncbi:MAG: endonuclease MutS2, partial [Traorella sp.]